MARHSARTSPSEPPPPLPEGGTESHFSWTRTRMSAERTCLAWMRFSLTLIGFGFTAYQALGNRPEAAAHPHAARDAGLLFVGAGVVAMVVGVTQREAELAFLRSDPFHEIGWRPGLPRWATTNLLAAVVILIGLAVLRWIAAGG